mmetsp:Transcript_92104/g.259640  ORF Transcript_92104/g.259640 Transcript_92104/m.259640 type:complete len:226 (+) Transcript_92104:118-795(+)
MSQAHTLSGMMNQYGHGQSRNMNGGRSGVYGGYSGGGGGGHSGGYSGGYGTGGGHSGGMSAPMYSGVFGHRATSKLSPQEKEIIEVAFDAFKDETGFITTERLREAFAQIDALGDIADIQMLIDDIDENGDGKIDEDEFRHIMTRKFLGEDDDSSFVHAFEMLDANRDGYIPIADFRHILMKEGNQPLSEQEADELLMFADVEGDGLIEYKPFLRWLINPDSAEK